MRHDGVLQLDGGDPFAARLDHILGPVDDLDVTVGVDPGHVARAEPTVLGQLARVVTVVIAAGDPRPPDLDLAERDAVPRQLFSARGVRDPDLAAWRHPALSPAEPQLAFRLGSCGDA